MAVFTQATAQSMLDAEFPTSGSTDYIAWSENGTSESSNLARTQLGATGWAAATAASPSVKANSTALTTAGATGAASITSYAVFSAATGGTQKTAWLALTASKTLAVGDKLSAAVGALSISLI